MTPYDAETGIAIQRVDIGDPMSTEWSCKGVFDTPIGGHGMQLCPHEKFDCQQFGLFTQTVLGGVELELTTPSIVIGGRSIRFNATTGDPNGQTVRFVGIG